MGTQRGERGVSWGDQESEEVSPFPALFPLCFSLSRIQPYPLKCENIRYGTQLAIHLHSVLLANCEMVVMKRGNFLWKSRWPKKDLESQMTVTAHSHPLSMQSGTAPVHTRVLFFQMRAYTSAAPKIRSSVCLKAKFIYTGRKHDWPRAWCGFFHI